MPDGQMQQIQYGGVTHSFPSDFTQDDIAKALKTWDARQSPSPTQMANQALAASGIPGGAATPASNVSPAWQSQGAGLKPDEYARSLSSVRQPMQMQESMIPSLVKGASSSLPVIGGMGGAILGAPAFGGGAVVGGALGAAGGQAANISLQNALFNYQPPVPTQQGKPMPPETSGMPPTVGGQAASVAMAGALGGLAEVPGQLAISVGNRVLRGIAAAKPLTEFGDAAAGLQEAAPLTATRRGVATSISTAKKSASEELGNVLQGNTKTSPIDPVIAKSRQALEDMATNPNNSPVLQGVGKSSLARFDKVVESAKYNVGITGNTATPDQLFNFQQELQKPGWVGNPGPVAEVLRNTFRQTYTDAGQMLRIMAPEADNILTRLTNLHAADAAVRAYRPGAIASTMVSAGMRPRTTAALSPFVAGVATQYPKARKMVGGMAEELVP